MFSFEGRCFYFDKHLITSGAVPFAQICGRILFLYRRHNLAVTLREMTSFNEVDLDEITIKPACLRSKAAE